MIVIRFTGGLGNQMFQFALGTHLALKNKTELKIDTTLLLDRSQPHEVVTHRNLDIDIFNIQLHIATQKDIWRFNGRSYKNYFGKLVNRISWQFKKKNLILEKSRDFQHNILALPDNKCLVGAWQSEKYFEEISSKIKSLYIFKDHLLKLSESLGEKIKTSNSVCLHVRRGDYVSSKVYSNTIGVLDKEYYIKAIELIQSKVKDPCFFIFSDDINWCKENLKINVNHEFIGDEHAGHKVGNYLQLMTLCKNFIISNSTFSWWAAYLGEKSGSIIIGPVNWFKDKNLSCKDILPKRWISL